MKWCLSMWVFLMDLALWFASQKRQISSRMKHKCIIHQSAFKWIGQIGSVSNKRTDDARFIETISNWATTNKQVKITSYWENAVKQIVNSKVVAHARILFLLRSHSNQLVLKTVHYINRWHSNVLIHFSWMCYMNHFGMNNITRTSGSIKMH